MKTGKALLAVLAGIAAGAALGVLFAPGRGSDTRKKISNKGDRLSHAMNKKIDEKFQEFLGVITGKQKTSKSERNSEVQQSTIAGD